jgi:hypothetical protein
MGLLLKSRLKRQNLSAVEINVAIAEFYITERVCEPGFPGMRGRLGEMLGRGGYL